MHKLAFTPGKSLVHRLYPVTKLFWLVFISIILFAISSGYILIGIAGILFLLLMVIQREIWDVRGFRFVLATGFFLFLLYVLFIKGGYSLLNPGPRFLRVTSEGIETGLLFSGRFFVIVFASYIFIITTDPSNLAYALMRLGLPYRYGFMLVTSLRLAPILEDEGRTIYQAQMVRGVRYDKAGLKKILLLIRQFLTPLLIISLRRADRLFFSMEGRGFGREKNRTFRKKIRPTWLDLYCSLGLLMFFTIIILFELGGLG